MHFKTLILALLFCGNFNFSYQISSPSDPTYNAGIVEFAPEKDGTSKAKVKKNSKRMKEIIESNETRDLDILVFPEGVINDLDWPTYVPDPSQKIAPCDIPDYDNFLVELSCSARSRKLYVVINLTEKEHCAVKGYKDKCDPSGLNYYNTNVVFDRQGRVISRYRKTHLYRYEWNRFSIKSKPELATFQTDFGVTFGHFICFDMLFYDPAQVLLRDHNISDIIYPTYWFNELPFLTAVQFQEGFAIGHDVNLLAANGNLPNESQSGSGIYAGKFGRLTASIYEDSKTYLLKAKVPKRDRRSDYQLPPQVVPQFVPEIETPRFTDMYLLRDYNVDVFTTKLLDAEFTTLNETLCHGSFCCQFDGRRQLISRSSIHSSYRFRLVAYDGDQTTFQRIDRSEIAVCALVACTNEELYSCGHIFPENVLVGNKYYFASINVKAAFRNAQRRSIMPTTVDGVMMPLPMSMYDWKEENKATTTDVSLSLTTPKADLLTFGVWANYYSNQMITRNLDSLSAQKNSSGAIAFSMLNLVFIFVGGFISKHFFVRP